MTPPLAPALFVAAALWAAAPAFPQTGAAPVNGFPATSAAAPPLVLQRAPPDDRPLDEWLALRGREVALGARGRQVVAPDMILVAPVVGRYAEALVYDDVGADPRPDAADPLAPLRGFVPADALETVVAAAATRQVVMVNEAHPVPQHRAFTLQLLARLRALGFTWFAAETLFEEDTALQRRGYPVAGTGAYTSEPVYGDLVRTALRLGFHVVAYDSPPGIDLDPRERLQAANLAERILKADPHARIVVHAGYGHIAKWVRPGSIIPMAIRFRELTGIDPYTVDQAHMTERSRPEVEEPLYRAVTRHEALTRPTVFVNEAGHPWSSNPAMYDAVVFSPRSEYQQGRPTWLRMGGLRQPHPLSPDVCAGARACLVRARYAAESADAVPVDQVLVVAGAPVPALVLPPGRFQVTVEGPNRSTLRAFTLEQPHG